MLIFNCQFHIFRMEFLAYAVVGTVGTAAGLIGTPALVVAGGLVGISNVGIGAGTLVSVAQSYVGNLATGSAISAMQSAVMAAAAL